MSLPQCVQIAADGTCEFDGNRWHFEAIKDGWQWAAFPLTARVLLQGQERHYHTTFHEQWFVIVGTVDVHGAPLRQCVGLFLAWRN